MLKRKQIRPGDKVVITMGCRHGETGVAIDLSRVPLRSTAGGLIPDVPGAYKPMSKTDGYIGIRYDRNSSLDVYHRAFLKLQK
jgi:hypothetical protein